MAVIATPDSWSTVLRSGDLESISATLQDQPGFATLVVPSTHGPRSPLHVLTDWPGFHPRAPAAVRLLLAAGAQVDVRLHGATGETPLHWAASSDDADVAAALLDGGADARAPGGSIPGGTPLDNAVGYGAYQVARLLASRGVPVVKLWHAAALGMADRLELLLDADPPPPPTDIDESFWHACAAGERRTAELLAHRGADINLIPPYAKAPPLIVAAGPSTRRQLLVEWLRGRGAAAEAR